MLSSSGHLVHLQRKGSNPGLCAGWERAVSELHPSPTLLGWYWFGVFFCNPGWPKMACVKQAGITLGVVFQSAPATLVLLD